MPDIKKQLVKNSASTILQIIATFISGLIFPPILVAKLGFDTYGIWALIVLLNQYTMLLDLGLQTGLIKFSSEYYTKGDLGKVNGLFLSNLVLYLIISTIVGLFLILYKDSVMHQFFGESIKYENLYDIALLYSLASLFNLITYPFSSLLKGLQRYDISNFIDIIFIILNASTSIIFVLFDFGLLGLVYGFLVSLTVKFIILVIQTKRMIPFIKFRTFSFKMFTNLRILFTFAPADLSVKIFSAITQTLIRFSLKNYAGISTVGIYDIAKRLVGQILGFSSSIFIPFLPAMSSLSAQNKRDEISAILKKASLYLNLFSLPILFYLLFFFEPALKLWLNITDVTAINLAASILLISTLLDLYTGPITTSSIGFGVIRLQVIKLGLTGVLLSILVIILGSLFSFKGILTAELAANLTALIFSTSYFDKLFGYNYTSVLLKSFFDIVKVVLPTVLIFFLVWVIFNETLRTHFIIFGIIAAVTSGILILIFLIKLNIVSKSELLVLKNIIIKKQKELDT
jgi:O-antigen/teichoic acid export membrane protein